MTEQKVFLADTYALIEIAGGNKDYEQYTGHLLVTTELVLIELYYHFLHDYDQKTADKYLSFYSRYVIPISHNSIRNGMLFKLEFRKEKLSYTDCIGYALALELGVRFLTGDEKFRNKENVEFVK